MNEKFEVFWKAYPRKVGKSAALKAWLKLVPDEDLNSRILTSIDVHKQSANWKKNHGEFIPHPATYLNQGRWDDELEIERIRPIMGCEFRRLEFKPGVHPNHHECHGEVAKMQALKEQGKKPKMSEARAWLGASSWYEALHVRCAGEIAPVCRMCGETLYPWKNPMIVGLINRFPQETKDWNPYHKGFMACDICAKSPRKAPSSTEFPSKGEGQL